MSSGRRMIGASLLAISVVALVTYFPALRIGFVGDDWTFVGKAAALPLGEYLRDYFAPFDQARWYRPVQGLQYLLEYAVFKDNAVGYHILHIAFHLVTALLFFDLTRRVAHNWRLGFLAALIFGAMSVFGWSVLWVAEAAPLQTLFYLAAMWLWWRYLRNPTSRDYVLTFAAFLLALLTKEPAITLPVTLFLMEWLLLPKPLILRGAMRRYAPFVLVAGVYAGIEYVIIAKGIFAYAYGGGSHVLSNLLHYLTLLACPWNLPSPFNFVWLVLAASLLAALLVTKRSRALAFLLAASVVSFLPFLPNEGASERYFYNAAMASALALALLFENARLHLPRRAITVGASIAIVLLMMGDSGRIAARSVELTDLARFNRTPLRAVSQRHPTLQPNTLIYFIDPFVPTADLSGMFYLRYGANVVVGGTDRAERARLSAHNRAYVYWTDERGEYREQAVERETVAQSATALPTDFQNGIRLEAFELASARVRREEAIVLLLYWQATAPIEKDYKIFAHLVNARGEQTDGYDSEPQAGKRRASSWRVGETIVDWTLFTVPATAPSGDYRLEIGLYHAPTLQRVAIVDARGNAIGDHVTIAPLRIVK